MTLVRILSVVFILVVGCAKAQEPSPVTTESTAAAASALDPIEARLYPPELILDHQAALGLADDARSMILAEMQRAQTRLVQLDASLRLEKERLSVLLDETPVDAPRATTIARGIASIEGEVKVAHLEMLIRIKNTLTGDQRAQLDELRR
jgi:hypothetical protein